MVEDIKSTRNDELDRADSFDERIKAEKEAISKMTKAIEHLQEHIDSLNSVIKDFKDYFSTLEG